MLLQLLGSAIMEKNAKE